MSHPTPPSARHREGGDASLRSVTSASKSARKRQITETPSDKAREIGITIGKIIADPSSLASSPRKRAKKAARTKVDANGEVEERRLRVFRKHAPLSYLERLDRVRSQRMFLIERQRKMSEDRSHEEETFEIAGTTGNIYSVCISRHPTCSCPDNAKGNQCKHIIYVLVNVLKAPAELAYQLAFLFSELSTIFSRAPATPQSANSSDADQSHPGKRKEIEGDCPVCVMEFSPSEDIVWCKAACGNNIHRQCSQQWASSKPGQPKCVYCRTLWQHDGKDATKVGKTGERNAEGYMNVADQLGLSGLRDYSSYHQPWARMNENLSRF